MSNENLNEKIFYYRFNKLNAWLILNLALTITLGYWGVRCPCLLFWVQTQVLLGVCLLSWLAWGWKYVLKHKAVVVDDEGIKIDYCQKLPWKDIARTEEKDVRCCFRNCRVLTLVPKDGISYRYNFLQKHNGDFTPFAIPLYGLLSPEDEKEIAEIVAEKAGKRR